jgi:hypothetical protein
MHDPAGELGRVVFFIGHIGGENMRVIKVLGLLAAASAFMGAAAASSSALTVTSCESVLNCKTTAVNTTFRMKSPNVKFSNGFLTNTCSSELGLTATDVLSNSGSDPIDADINEIGFSGCNLAEVHVAGIPWTLTTNSVEFPKGKLSGINVTLTVPFVGTCVFAQDATHNVTITWNNATKSTMTLGGSLAKTSGLSGCGTDVAVSGTYTISAVADPGYAKANNLIID